MDADVGDGPGDGRAGDLDDITDAERILGSRFGDRLLTQRARRQVDVTLDGGAGDDTLTSGAGRDVLTGGAGIDTISGLGEVDRILAQDRDRDNIDCGSGAPDEALVSLIGEGSIIGCEKVLPVRTATNNGGLVGTPRLMPAALRLSAGEPPACAFPGATRARARRSAPGWRCDSTARWAPGGFATRSRPSTSAAAGRSSARPARSA